MEITLPCNLIHTHIPKDSVHLNEQEFEILHMVIAGFSIKEIQQNIQITNKGVKWRLNRLYRKFCVKDRLELIKKAHLQGLKFLTGSVARGRKPAEHIYAIKIEANNG